MIFGVTGTDTGVGKTLVAAALTRALVRRGVGADALKLLATGSAGMPGEDATVLGNAAGRSAEQFVLETFALPRSPLAAATAEGRRIDVGALIARTREREKKADFLVLEGVGGLYVPLTPHATVADVFRSLDAHMIIVARAGLGTINHSVLTVEACLDRGLRCAGVLLSNSDNVDRAFAEENAAQIAAQSGVRVLGVLPWMPAPGDVDTVARALSESIDLDELCEVARSGAQLRARAVRADRRHVWHPFTQTTEWLDEEPLVIRAGEGSWLIDEDGRRFLDGIASLWANVHGHAHPLLDRTLREQAGRISHTTFLGLTHAPGALLAEELAQVTPEGLDRVFYSEAGAAAVEVALRIALLAQQRRGHPERIRFLSLDEAYHGDTAGAVSVGRSEPFHRGLDPLLFDVIRVPSPHVAGETAALEHLDAALAAHGETLAAFVVEPRIQGAAGMLPHSDAWLRAAIDRAHASGLLVVCDEVATGFGRTGDLFASAGAGVLPDILVLGKGLSGGYLPLSATIVGQELYALFTAPYGEHRTLYYGHTYTANPLACAVARASLELFRTDDTVDRARSLAEALSRELPAIAAIDVVAEIRQRGVMIGVELRNRDGSAFDPALRIGRRVTLAARRRGVIVRPLGDVIVINPPLVMSAEEASLLVSTLRDGIEEVSARQLSV